MTKLQGPDHSESANRSLVLNLLYDFSSSVALENPSSSLDTAKRSWNLCFISCSDHDIFLSTSLGRGVHAAVDDALAGPAERVALAEVESMNVGADCGPAFEKDVFSPFDGSCWAVEGSWGGLEERVEKGVCWFDILDGGRESGKVTSCAEQVCRASRGAPSGSA